MVQCDAINVNKWDWKMQILQWNMKLVRAQLGKDCGQRLSSSFPSATCPFSIIRGVTYLQRFGRVFCPTVQFSILDESPVCVTRWERVVIVITDSLNLIQKFSHVAWSKYENQIKISTHPKIIVTSTLSLTLLILIAHLFFSAVGFVSTANALS